MSLFLFVFCISVALFAARYSLTQCEVTLQKQTAFDVMTRVDAQSKAEYFTRALGEYELKPMEVNGTSYATTLTIGQYEDEKPTSLRQIDTSVSWSGPTGSQEIKRRFLVNPSESAMGRSI